MADLDTLRPEIRDAVDSLDKSEGIDFAWLAVRAELLRLADDCARLVDCINAQPPTRRSLIDRAERAEADLAAAQNTIAAQQDTMGALKRKLALAEGELAALKARIADAPVVTINDSAHIIGDGYVPSLRGKRVRLVVED